MIKWKIASVTICVLWMLSPVVAQDAPTIITADNIMHLQSVTHIDFADAPPEAGKIDNGWFAFSSGGDFVAVKNRSDEVVIWSLISANVVDVYAVQGSDNLPTTFLDADFTLNDEGLVSIHTEQNMVYVAYWQRFTKTLAFRSIMSSDIPLRVWADTAIPLDIWLEMAPFDSAKSRYIVRTDSAAMETAPQNAELNEIEAKHLLSGPENDPDSFLRIGRIDPPLAITITRNRLVKRWNLETGEVISTAQVDALPGAGQLTTDGRYFAWRDGESKALHLLDFETGEDRVVADLGGTYLPFMAVTPAADIIIGVNAGLQPVVTAWNTATGEKFDLGEYRQCNRQPDMVRLSHYGTILVIGCDTGLDIWRIKNPQ